MKCNFDVFPCCCSSSVSHVSVTTKSTQLTRTHSWMVFSCSPCECSALSFYAKKFFFRKLPEQQATSAARESFHSANRQRSSSFESGTVVQLSSMWVFHLPSKKATNTSPQKRSVLKSQTQEKYIC